MITKGFILFITTLIIVFTISFFAITKEGEDDCRLEKKFKKIEKNKDAIYYLNYISNSPIWRVGVLGTLINGLLFYLIYGAISKGGYLDKHTISLCLFVMIFMYVNTISIVNYIKYHHICPSGCANAVVNLE